MTTARALALAMAAVAGVATVVGFAPFGVAHLPILTLSLLFALWNSASSPRAAAETGFAFGLGLFGAGVSWVYIALETFGGMPTAIAIIATAAMVAYLALWPAIAGYVAVRFTQERSVARIVAEVRNEANDLVGALVHALDDEAAFSAARMPVRELKFLAKLAEDSTGTAVRPVILPPGSRKALAAAVESSRPSVIFSVASLRSLSGRSDRS